MIKFKYLRIKILRIRSYIYEDTECSKQLRCV